MYRLDINGPEIDQINEVIREVRKEFDSVEDPALQRRAVEYAQEFPRSVRASLNTFRLSEPHSVCVVAGYPLDDRELGSTPAHWKDRDESRTVGFDVYFYLLGCLLGEPIAWATQQDGRIMHDVLPIKDHEYEQIGSGSKELVTWHTEDAFHPLRSDYVGLMCLRNPDGVETTYASTHDLDLHDPALALLWEKRFPIRPDHSHTPGFQGAQIRRTPEEEELLRRSYEAISKLSEDPEPLAVLFGDPNAPYLRLDPFFMEKVRDDAEAQRALDVLAGQIDRTITGYALRPGEALFLDNYTAVHGRKPFSARFDGTDRWLKRLCVARDLRASRAQRTTPDSRVIF
ncbi:guanitoxin biosynthesis L-enduracididine beta-hydroxylase GntD [Streptomyces decoyicus]|uniref:guanitoxin biosynthesis L-enduracididine beta-hydroxylase GntD n=1 Tax=Streptomyces decoyicus TaxID=249567 RepID=UPI0033B5A183